MSSPSSDGVSGTGFLLSADDEWRPSSDSRIHEGTSQRFLLIPDELQRKSRVIQELPQFLCLNAVHVLSKHLHDGADIFNIIYARVSECASYDNLLFSVHDCWRQMPPLRLLCMISFMVSPFWLRISYLFATSCQCVHFSSARNQDTFSVQLRYSDCSKGISY